MSYSLVEEYAGGLLPDACQHVLDGLLAMILTLILL